MILKHGIIENLSNNALVWYRKGMDNGRYNRSPHRIRSLKQSKTEFFSMGSVFKVEGREQKIA